MARMRQSRPDSFLGFQVEVLDRLRVGWPYGICGRDTRQEDVEKPFDSSTRRVTYPESYITKYTTYTKIKEIKLFPLRSEADGEEMEVPLGGLRGFRFGALVLFIKPTSSPPIPQTSKLS